MTHAGSYSLKWHGHGGHLNASVSSLYRSEAFTDVVLATADGRYISAHQFVLSACSQYLHNMFLVGSLGLRPLSKIVVVLPFEISYATLSILLQYIYKGEAIVNHEQLPHIMKAAEILQVRGLCKQKEKPDNKTGVLKQQNKNCTESNSTINGESVKLNHRILIPEVNYSDPTSKIVDKNKSRRNSTSSACKASSSDRLSPVRKKSKSNHKESLENQTFTNTESNAEEREVDVMGNNMIIGEEILVKEEPIDWEEEKSIDESENKIKEEDDQEEEVEEDKFYPLSCDLCQKTFNSPAMWVRHIEKEHPSTTLASGKQTTMEDNSEGFTPLHCELCQKTFSVPAEWVRHIQAHSKQELVHSNELAQSSRNRIECNLCGKLLQSQASMQIHARTHTGERPYICKACGREFNVKSNYVRHLRTLHDQIV